MRSFAQGLLCAWTCAVGPGERGARGRAGSSLAADVEWERGLAEG